MTKIEHTNIIIDDFSIAKHQTTRVYAHILTHIHTDHLKGLHDGWNYGPIYCSQPTKKLLLHKFPNILNVNILQLCKPTVIKISPTLSVTVTFLDANHCIGAVMVLIQGYMGTILYTGDMRFDREIFKNYTNLYPPHKLNQRFQACSKQIDILYVDNTFLKKKFNFPPKAVVLKMAVNFFQELLNLNQHTRLYIGLDSFGKEEVLVELSEHFEMYIVVDDLRYDLLEHTPLDIEMFTRSKSSGVVEVVRKDKLYANLKKTQHSIGMILSGWVNQPTYKFNDTIYCLPYSLHSNYREIHEFIDSIRPSFIYPIVHVFPDQNKLFYAHEKDVCKRDLMFKENLFEEEKGNYQLQIQELRSLYTVPPTEQYKAFTTNIEWLKKIQENLVPPNYSNFFTSQKVTPIHMQAVQRKKYKLATTRNELQINRLKNRIQLKKKIMEGQPIEIIDEDQEKAVSIQDISKSKSDVIAIEDKDKFQDMKEDGVVVDPLFEPISLKRKLSHSKEERKDKITAKREYDPKLIQHVRNKLKELQRNPKTLNHYFRKQDKNNSYNVENEDLSNIQKLPNFELQSEKANETANKGKNQSARVHQTYRGINFEHVKKIKVFNKKQEALNNLKQGPQKLQIIQHLLKVQQHQAQK